MNECLCNFDGNDAEPILNMRGEIPGNLNHH